MNGANQPPSKWSEGQAKIGTGEGESPLAPPPQPKMDMRTMESDLRSIQETGGQTVKPYAPPGGGMPPEPTFQPPQIETTPPASPPPPTMPSGPATMTPLEPSKPKGKGLWITLLIIIVVIGLAAVGYFFIYPALFPADQPGQPTVEPPPVETPPPAPEEQPPIVPPAEEPEPEPEPAEPSADTLPTVSNHVSLFKTPADAVLDVTLPSATLSSFRSAILAAPITADGFREIVVRNSLGQPIALSGLMPLLVPGFFDAATLARFEEDVTLFVHSASGQVHLGYVAKLRDNADVGQAQERMSALQQDSANGNLFLAAPGELGVWRDGTIAGKPASVVDFSQPGATLGYVWLEKNLLLTTSLAGGEEAAERLGF